MAPPGIVLIASNLPQLVAPPVVLYIATYLLKKHREISLPVWLLALAYTFSWPTALFLYQAWKEWKLRRAAAAAGAVLPPRIKTNSLLGLDIVKMMQEDSEKRFLGYRSAMWSEQYGHTYDARALLQARIVTTEPDYIKRILATNFPSFEKGPTFYQQMKSLLGTGVFNSDGDMWKFHRSMTRPFFSRDRISHFDVFDRHAEVVIRLIRERMAAGDPLDWQDLVSRFTLDSATEFLFGKDVCSLSAGLPYPPTSEKAKMNDASSGHPANKFAKSFLDAQLESSKRSKYSALWPLWEFWESKVDKKVKVMDEFIQPLLKDALAQKSKFGGKGAGDEEVGEDTTLLEHLVRQTDDPQIIRDETLNILLAGRDTTAHSLTMAVYKLAHRPEILRRLREEIMSCVGSRRPDYDDIRDMKYLRAFINEVLRLYPAVPFNVRFTNSATTWPSHTPGERPFYIPAQTRTMYSVFVMHRRKDLWGPTALQFDPDRFLDDRVTKYLTPNPFIFLPFNAGPRICLGQQFAYNEMSFMLIRLLQQVTEIKLVQEVNPEAVPAPGWSESGISDGSDNVKIKAHLTMYVEGGLWVEMKTTSAGDV